MNIISPIAADSIGSSDCCDDLIAEKVKLFLQLSKNRFHAGNIKRGRRLDRHILLVGTLYLTFKHGPRKSHQYNRCYHQCSTDGHRHPLVRIVPVAPMPAEGLSRGAFQPLRINAVLRENFHLFRAKILANNGDHRLYTVPAQPGICRWSANLSPTSDEGWTATGDLVLRGAYRPRDLDAHDLAETLAASLLPDGEVADLEVRIDSPEELSLRLTAHGETLGDIDGDLLIRTLPWPDHGVLSHLPAGFQTEIPTRTTPLWIEFPGEEHVTLRIELPTAWQVDSHPPATHQLTTNAATLTHSASQEDDALILTRTLKLTQAEVSPTDYPDLRNLLTTALQTTTTPLILVTE